MIPDFFRTIASAFERRKLDVILIGGWAVNEHGFHRQTRDIDFAFLASRKSDLLAVLKDLGYTPFSDSSLVTRFDFREPFMPIVDVLWIDDSTHNKMSGSAVSMENVPSMKVIGLRNLLAMKLHALKSADEQRGDRDVMDIVTLMKHNPNAPSQEEFIDLCAHFGPPGIYHEFSRKWNL